jgi:Excalibur calcium-binding domain
MPQIQPQQSQLGTAACFAIAVAFVASIQGSVFAATSQIAKNEATLSRFSTCGAANKVGYKNLKTRVGFTPKSAKRSFDADKDGISCEAR